MLETQATGFSARRRARITSRHFASINEAAEYLSCEQKLIRKMISRGHLTGYRLPGSPAIRVDLDELDAAIEATTRKAG